MPGDGWLGVRRDGLDDALAAVRRDGFFLRRGDAEEDPTRKQVIPYLVLRDGERWFLMRRTRAGGNARLHDLWSIGVANPLEVLGDAQEPGGVREGTWMPRIAPTSLSCACIERIDGRVAAQ